MAGSVAPRGFLPVIRRPSGQHGAYGGANARQGPATTPRLTLSRSTRTRVRCLHAVTVVRHPWACSTPRDRPAWRRTLQVLDPRSRPSGGVRLRARGVGVVPLFRSGCSQEHTGRTDGLSLPSKSTYLDAIPVSDVFEGRRRADSLGNMDGACRRGPINGDYVCVANLLCTAHPGASARLCKGVQHGALTHSPSPLPCGLDAFATPRSEESLAIVVVAALDCLAVAEVTEVRRFQTAGVSLRPWNPAV